MELRSQAVRKLAPENDPLKIGMDLSQLAMNTPPSYTVALA